MIIWVLPVGLLAEKDSFFSNWIFLAVGGIECAVKGAFEKKWVTAAYAVKNVHACSN